MITKLGWHISKQGTYINSLKTFAESKTSKWNECPVQIFTGSTKMWRRCIINEKDLSETKEYINNNNVELFIHSIYLINLCRINDEFKKARMALIYDLNVGEKMGAKGVVVHVGKCLNMGKDVGTYNMYKNILSILPYINESCPLLIETPAGEGTELLVTLEELHDFYDKFTPDEKKKVKICIDTCHVFAAGYDPSKYLEDWNNRNPDSIVLVHFNDSKHECGCKKDRHAPSGEGFIGIDKLNYITQWCTNLNIPMIREY